MEIIEVLKSNLISMGSGMGIFCAAYLSNVLFGVYYNVKVLKESFDIKRILESALKALVFIVGAILLTTAITLVLPWANANGLAIPEEFQEVVSVFVIFGIVLYGCGKYIAEAVEKLADIMGKEKEDVE